jgi:hypothetical protein
MWYKETQDQNLKHKKCILINGFSKAVRSIENVKPKYEQNKVCE